MLQENKNYDDLHEKQIKAGLASGLFRTEREARRQLLHGDDVASLSETEIKTAEEEAKRTHREETDAKWEQIGQEHYARIMTAEQSGALRLTQPWDKLPQDILHDPNVIKIEAGGKYSAELLNFEHRNIKDQEHILLPPSSAQISYLFSRDPELARKTFEGKNVVLGDVDMGGSFGYWLIEQVRQGQDISKYRDLVNFISLHDASGRIAIFPHSEPDSSLANVNWGIALAHDGDKERRLALYMQTFDRVVADGLDVYGNVPFPNKETAEMFRRWKEESHAAIEKAVREGKASKNAVVLDNFNPLGTTKWDQAAVEIHRRFNGEKVAITISVPGDNGSTEMQASSFGNYYMAPFGEGLNKKGKSAWFGTGYVGMYSTPDYTATDFVASTERYLDDNREAIKQAAEFEVIFDDQAFLESVITAALKDGLITGFTKSPEYYKATASYLWDEYGHGLEEGKERHAKINTDNIVVLRFMVGQQDKDKVFHFINEQISKKWDTPLIKITEKGVNKKFADYLAQNVAHDKPEAK